MGQRWGGMGCGRVGGREACRREGSTPARSAVCLCPAPRLSPPHRRVPPSRPSPLPSANLLFHQGCTGFTSVLHQIYTGQIGFTPAASPLPLPNSPPLQLEATQNTRTRTHTHAHTRARAHTHTHTHRRWTGRRGRTGGVRRQWAGPGTARGTARFGRAAPALHPPCTSFTPALHQLYASFIPALHQLYTSFIPALHQLYTSFTPAVHQLCIYARARRLHAPDYTARSLARSPTHPQPTAHPECCHPITRICTNSTHSTRVRAGVCAPVRVCKCARPRPRRCVRKHTHTNTHTRTRAHTHTHILSASHALHRRTGNDVIHEPPSPPAPPPAPAPAPAAPPPVSPSPATTGVAVGAFLGGGAGGGAGGGSKRLISVRTRGLPCQ